MNEKTYQLTLKFLDELFEDYKVEVEGSALAASSKKDYLMFVEQFIRWTKGNFSPGENV